MNRRKLMAAAAALVLTVSGCDFIDPSVDTLLKPPTLSEEQEQIRAAMQQDPEVEGDISLVYPRTGDYRSAYVIENIDGESTKEALVFYRENSSSTAAGTTAIKINVLDQVEDAKGNRRWVSRLISNEINASSIEKIDIVQLEEQYYIIIGFDQINADVNGNTKELKVFSYEETADQGLQLVNKLSVPCVGYTVYDLDDDGAPEITALVGRTSGETKAIYGQLYDYRDEMFEKDLVEVAMNTSVTEYSGIYPGVLETGQPVIYLDGIYGKLAGTEILAVENNILCSLSPPGGRSLWELTSRPSDFSVMDLDGDRVYEIPKWLNVQQSDSQLDLISWSHYDANGLTQFVTTYTDYALGYWFAVPEGWQDVVDTRKDLTTNETSFYLPNPDDPDGDPLILLKIKVQTSTEIPLGYEKLDTRGELIYLYQKYPQNLNKVNLTLSDSTIKKSFHHL